MQRTKDFYRLIWSLHRRIQQRSFKGANITLAITRGTVPCCRNNCLIVINFAIFYFDPMAKSAPWSTTSSRGPGSAKGKGKKNTPCRFYARGNCDKGDSCLFKH